MSQDARYPFSAFNFSVEIRKDGSSAPLCEAAFSECDGLEMSMEVKTIREGGNNGTQIRLVGPAAFGQVILKRGMTSSFDLWDWWIATMDNPALRATVTVTYLGSEQDRPERARFVLSRCLPVKLKAPPLNAKEGIVAIEELQIAYESLRLERPKGQ